MSYVYVWSYAVRPGREEEFERAYGPAGPWAALFREESGYEGTELLRDASGSGRYATIDRWRSQEDWQRMRREHAEKFEAIDRECARLTLEENELGRFESL